MIAMAWPVAENPPGGRLHVLDVTIQAQVLDLLKGYSENGMSIVMITHDRRDGLSKRRCLYVPAWRRLSPRIFKSCTVCWTLSCIPKLERAGRLRN